MAFTTNPYCTLAQVKVALDLVTDNSLDAWLQELINEAQELVDQEIGYPFQTDGSVSTPASRSYDGDNSGKLVIDPVISLAATNGVQEVVYNIIIGSNGQFQSGTTNTTDITADVILGPSTHFNTFYGYWFTLQRKTGLPFMQGTANYIVNGVFGRPNVPPAITRACVRIVTHWYGMKSTYYADQVIEQGMVRQKYSKMLPADVVEILKKFTPKRFKS